MDVISKFHGTETTKIKQKNKDEIIALILRPQAVNDYNIHMGGETKQTCSVLLTALPENLKMVAPHFIW